MWQLSLFVGRDDHEHGARALDGPVYDRVRVIEGITRELTLLERHQ